MIRFFKSLSVASPLRLLPVLALLTVVLASSCGDDDNTVNNYKVYAEWRESNDAFYNEQKDLLDDYGQPYYTQITPPWNHDGGILLRYLNDRTLTEGNLTPLLTSTVSVKYIGHLMNGTPIDSSYTAPDSTFTNPVSNLIAGWQTALQYMRVGDSVRVVIPALQAYGSAGSGAVLPYSTLIFDIKLKNIPYYEAKP